MGPAAQDPDRLEDRSLAVHEAAVTQHIQGVEAVRIRPVDLGADPAQALLLEAIGRELDDPMKDNGRSIGARAVLGRPQKHPVALE